MLMNSYNWYWRQNVRMWPVHIPIKKGEVDTSDSSRYEAPSVTMIKVICNFSIKS